MAGDDRIVRLVFTLDGGRQFRADVSEAVAAVVTGATSIENAEIKITNVRIQGAAKRTQASNQEAAAAAKSANEQLAAANKMAAAFGPATDRAITYNNQRIQSLDQLRRKLDPIAQAVVDAQRRVDSASANVRRFGEDTEKGAEAAGLLVRALEDLGRAQANLQASKTVTSSPELGGMDAMVKELNRAYNESIDTLRRYAASGLNPVIAKYDEATASARAMVGELAAVNGAFEAGLIDGDRLAHLNGRIVDSYDLSAVAAKKFAEEQAKVNATVRTTLNPTTVGQERGFTQGSTIAQPGMPTGNQLRATNIVGQDLIAGAKESAAQIAADNQAAFNSILGISDKVSRLAKDSAAFFQEVANAEKEVIDASLVVERRFAELTAKFDPDTASAMGFAKAIGELNEAQRLGVNIAGGYDKALELIRIKFGQLTEAQIALQQVQSRSFAGTSIEANKTRLVAAAPQAITTGLNERDVQVATDNQAAFNRLLGVNQQVAKSAQESAAAFDTELRAMEELAAAAQRVKDSLNPVAAIERNLGDEVSRLTTLLNAGRLSQDEFTAAQTRAKSAAQGKIADASGLTAAQTDYDRLSKSAQDYREKLNPLLEAQRRYTAAIKEQDEWVSVGLIPQKQANASIIDYTQKLATVETALKKVESEELTTQQIRKQNRLILQQVSRDFEDVNSTATKSFGLNRIGLLELQAAGINTFQSLAAGISPLRTAETEGAQVIGALIQGGLASAKQLILIVAPLAAVGATFAVLAGHLFTVTENIKQFNVQLQTFGLNAQLTGRDAQTMVEDLRKLGISAADAKAGLQAVFSTPGINPQRAKEIVTLAQDIAALPGRGNITAETDNINKALSGGVEQTIKFGTALGALSSSQIEAARATARNVSAQEALSTLFSQIRNNILPARDSMSVFGKAIIEVTNTFNSLVSAVSESDAFKNFINETVVGFIERLRDGLVKLKDVVESLKPDSVTNFFSNLSKDFSFSEDIKFFNQILDQIENISRKWDDFQQSLGHGRPGGTTTTPIAPPPYAGNVTPQTFAPLGNFTPTPRGRGTPPVLLPSPRDDNSLALSQEDIKAQANRSIQQDIITNKYVTGLQNANDTILKFNSQIIKTTTDISTFDELSRKDVDANIEALQKLTTAYDTAAEAFQQRGTIQQGLPQTVGGLAVGGVPTTVSLGGAPASIAGAVGGGGGNNVGNIRVPGSPNMFQTFATPQEGVQAIANQLSRYYSGATTGKPLTNLQDIINTYSPPSENNTSALVSRASGILGVSPTTTLNLSNQATMAKLVEATVRNEHGGILPRGITPEMIANVSIGGGVSSLRAPIVTSSVPVTGGVGGAQLTTIERANAADAERARQTGAIGVPTPLDIAEVAKINREFDDQIKIRSAFPAQSQIIQARIDAENKANELGLGINARKVFVDQAVAHAQTVLGTEADKASRAIALENTGTLESVKGLKESESAGLRAAAAEEARQQVQDRGGDKARIQQDILTKNASLALLNSRQQLAASEPVLQRQELLAAASARGAAAEHEQAIVNEAHAKTYDVLLKATAAYEQAQINGTEADKVRTRQLRELAEVEDREALTQARRADRATQVLENNRALQVNKDQAEVIRLQTSLQGQTTEEITKQTAILQVQQQLRNQGTALTEKEKQDRIDSLIQLQNWNKELIESQRHQERINQLFVSIGETISNSLGQALQDAFDGQKVTDWGTRLKQIISQILAQIAQFAVIRPIIGTALSAIGLQQAAQGFGTLGSTGGGGLFGGVGGVGGIEGVGGLSLGGDIGNFINREIGGALGFATTVPGPVTGLGASPVSAVLPGSLFGGTTLTSALGGIGAGIGAGGLVSGLLGGNKLIGTAGGGVGGIVGSIIGPLLGATGPIGGIVGGLIGGLGGLFGNNRPSNNAAGADINIGTGALSRVVTSDAASTQNVNQITQALGQFGAQIKQLTGVTPNISVAVQDGVRDGIKAGISGQAERKFGDPTSAINALELDIAHGLTGLSDTLTTVLAHVTDPAQIQSAIEFAAVYDNLKKAADSAFSSISTDTKQLGPFEQAMNSINATFGDLIAKANQFGLSLDPVNAGLGEATRRLQQDFIKTLDQASNSASGFDFINQLIAISNGLAQNTREARALNLLGDSTVQDKLRLVEVQQAQQVLANLTTQQLGQVFDALKDSNPEIAAMAKVLLDTGANAKGATSSLQNLASGIKSVEDAVNALTMGPLAGLTADQQLAADRGAFQTQLSTVRGAGAGVTTDQLTQLSALATTAVQNAQANFGNAPATADLRNQILTELRDVLSTTGTSTAAGSQAANTGSQAAIQGSADVRLIQFNAMNAAIGLPPYIPPYAMGTISAANTNYPTPMSISGYASGSKDTPPGRIMLPAYAGGTSTNAHNDNNWNWMTSYIGGSTASLTHSANMTKSSVNLDHKVGDTNNTNTNSLVMASYGDGTTIYHNANDIKNVAPHSMMSISSYADGTTIQPNMKVSLHSALKQDLTPLSTARRAQDGSDARATIHNNTNDIKNNDIKNVSSHSMMDISSYANGTTLYHNTIQYADGTNWTSMNESHNDRMKTVNSKIDNKVDNNSMINSKTDYNNMMNSKVGSNSMMVNNENAKVDNNKMIMNNENWKVKDINHENTSNITMSYANGTNTMSIVNLVPGKKDGGTVPGEIMVGERGPEWMLPKSIGGMRGEWIQVGKKGPEIIDQPGGATILPFPMHPRDFMEKGNISGYADGTIDDTTTAATIPVSSNFIAPTDTTDIPRTGKIEDVVTEIRSLRSENRYMHDELTAIKKQIQGGQEQAYADAQTGNTRLGSIDTKLGTGAVTPTRRAVG